MGLSERMESLMNIMNPGRRPLSTLAGLSAAGLALASSGPALAAGEADLVLPDLRQTRFLGGLVSGQSLLITGLFICAAGLVFGLVFYRQLQKLPVHRSMLEVSELIYATCKTYLFNQGKFILLLWLFIAAVIVAYFGFLSPGGEAGGLSRPQRVGVILLFSLIGIAGSYSVAWFGIRINTFANSRTSMASLTGSRYLCHSIPLKAGMSIGMVLISVELLIMLCILLFVPRALAGPCFIGFAIGESLGAAALRVAGRDLHQDRRHRRRPDEDRLQRSRKTTRGTPVSSPIARATTRATRSARPPTASRRTA